jgi:hypothetical protein
MALYRLILETFPLFQLETTGRQFLQPDHVQRNSNRLNPDITLSIAEQFELFRYLCELNKWN